MKLKLWLNKLIGAFIQGAGHGGSAYLGLAVAHAVEADIPSLNVKALGIIITTSALLKFFQFLDTNPLPTDQPEDPKPESKNETHP